jgi:hypothetical protein
MEPDENSYSTEHVTDYFPARLLAHLLNTGRRMAAHLADTTAPATRDEDQFQTSALASSS